MSQWYIKLPSELPHKAAQLRCALLGEDGQEVQTKTSTLDSLGPMGQVVLVLPAGAVSWHKAKLPEGIKGAASTKQALEGVLEERLLEDPAQMHLALMGKAAEGGDWVAACSKGYLKAWVEALVETGIAHKRIIPEARPTEQESARAYAPFGKGQASLALCGPAGVACVPMDSAMWQSGRKISCEAAVSLYWEQAGAQVEVVGFGQSMAWASGIDGGMEQFEFSTTSSAKAKAALKQAGEGLFFSKAWSKFRWGMAGAALLWAVQWTSMAHGVQSKIALAQAQARSEVAKAFPEITSVIEPLFQIKRASDALREGSGILAPGSLESLLSAMGKDAPSLSVSASSISYQQGVLSVESSAWIDSEQQALLQAGYLARHEGQSVLVSPIKKGESK